MTVRLSRKISHRRSAFTLVELLVVIAIIGILIALLVPAVQAARAAARRAQCQSNIKNVSLGVLNYESARKRTPVGMTFPKSLEASIGQLSVFNANWIINILPFIEEQATYNQFDLKRPINDPVPNSKNYFARGTKIAILLCPDDDRNTVMYQGYPNSGHSGNWARGNYAGNAGGAFLRATYCEEDPTICAYSEESAGWRSSKRRGVMGPNTSVRFRQITDGTSKTILIGEIRVGLTDKDARGVWAMGHAGASLLAMFGSDGDDNGPNNYYPSADDVYSDLCETPEALAQGMDCWSGTGFAQATVRSRHPGGAFVAMCDGSVRFIDDNVETSGSFGNWGSLWDRMIGSADASIAGTFAGTYP